MNHLARLLGPWPAGLGPRLGSLCLLALSACATLTGGGGAAGSGAGVGDPAPDLTVNGFYDSRPIPLSSLRGKVVLLDVWASWCVPCKAELPALDEMAPRLRAKGIEIVAVSVDEVRADAETFLRTRKNWALTLAHDPSGQVPERMKVEKMPTSYIIDARGVVRHVNAGYEPGDVEKIERRLLELAR
jgi:thiol-disulfide isomerase/thioredoxin